MSKEKIKEFEQEELNKRYNNEQLTIEQYRKVKGFENITQKEYDFISDYIYEFAQMLYDYKIK